jgi:hypothetical protein
MPISKMLEVGMRTEVIGGVVWSIYYSQVPGDVEVASLETFKTP